MPRSQEHPQAAWHATHIGVQCNGMKRAHAGIHPFRLQWTDYQRSPLKASPWQRDSTTELEGCQVTLCNTDTRVSRFEDVMNLVEGYRPQNRWKNEIRA